jgi:hypothetical protein
MIKSKYFLLLIISQVVSFNQINAQVRATLKNLFQSGERQVAKNLVREEAAAATKLRLSKNLTKGCENNIEKFWKKYHCSDVIDFGADLAEEIEKNRSNQEKISIYLNEIFSNVNYPKIYSGICKKYKKDTLKKYEVEYILLGNKINGIGIDSNKLYNLYFNFSQTFAREELEKLKLFYNCNVAVNQEINDIAQGKDIKLDKAICGQADGDGALESIIGLIAFAIAVYVLWRMLKKLFISIKKFRHAGNKSNTN